MADTSTVSQTEQNINNASTEVNFDSSIADRLSELKLDGNESLTNAEADKPAASTPPAVEKLSPEKPPKSAELTQSILAGEISDTSECSLEVEETSNESEGKSDTNASDEEMYIEQDHDEDVEEEEEFHEVEEEEKHKTSQESVGGDRSTSAKSRSKSPTLESSAPVSACSVPSVSKDSSETPEKIAETKEVAEVASAAEEPIITNEVTEIAAIDNAKVNLDSKDEPSEGKNNDWADIMSNVQGEEESTNVENSKPEQTSGEEPKEKAEDGEKKELDLDEDVKNPQYIPKKGIFYEHDDRSLDTDCKKQVSGSNLTKNDEESISETKDSSKKMNSLERSNDNRRANRRQRADADRWGHDRYKDDEQKPKSKNELHNAHGNDIRNRTRGSDAKQDRSRQTRDSKTPRQGQAPSNQTNERRARRPNNRNRTETSSVGARKDAQSNKPAKTDVRQDSQQVTVSAPRQPRDRLDRNDRVNRIDNRGRRQNSDDRPTSSSVDDKRPPINTVMPPITTWSNEEMVKEENIRRKESPVRPAQQNSPSTSNGNGYKGRSNEHWPQHNRYPQQQAHKGAQYLNRNHYGDRANQHPSDWRKNNHNISYNRPNEYEPIKTQTFENSQLAGMRSNPRDAREIINQRRLLNQQQNFQARQNFQPPPQNFQDQQQQSFQSKIQPLHNHHQHMQHFRQQQLHQPQHQLQHQQQHQQQNLQQHHRQQNQQQTQQQPAQQQPATTQQAQNQIQSQKSPQQQVPQNARQGPPQQQRDSHLQPSQHQTHLQMQPTHSRQTATLNNMASGPQESEKSHAVSTANSSDLINSRPIIKTDTYTGPTVASNSHPQTQLHSHNHRSLGGPMSQPGLSSTGTHLVPSHMNAGGAQAQYYAASGNSRESAAAAAALATAYHGYMPGGHSVMDSARYHMTSQQLTDHGYMPSSGQTNDLASAPVLHQQGIYTDAASAGGTVASSAYIAQASSTLSPSSNIPVTGAGPPQMAPVSYLQHSQYAPPPYSNPYSQTQHNQAPPQSSHGYSPYWPPYLNSNF